MFDLRDGKWKLRRVLETFTRITDDSLLSLIYRDGSIQVTPGHPFWVLRGEDLDSRPWPEHAGERLVNAALPGRWVDAGDLRVGDVLYLRGGEERAIEEIQVLAGGQRVYNFRVEELACYAVGGEGVLVHNASSPVHHIVSRYGNAARGWATNWTQSSQTLLKSCKIGIESKTNKVRVRGHKGPHPELYHKRVYQRLKNAVAGLRGKARQIAGQAELTQIGLDLKQRPSLLSGTGL